MSIRSPLLRLIVALLIALLLVCGVFLLLDLVKKPVVVARNKGNSSPLFALSLSTFNGPTVRIMPLGDSITAGVGSSTHGGYRTQLWQDCMDAHWHVQFVGSQVSGPASLPERQHEGHPGWRIAQISTHMVNWLQT
jgi:hypothetical protein